MEGARKFDPAECRRWMVESFVVDAGSGSLIWISPPKNHPRLVGTAAGSARVSASGEKYVHIKRDKVAIKRSWLIFLWANGRWPSDCLDHINGNSLDDSLSNIREATVTQNAWNHHKRSKASDLPMGVRLTGAGRYQARIAYNKRMIHLGTFDTPEQARIAYLGKRKELYHEFA